MDTLGEKEMREIRHKVSGSLVVKAWTKAWTEDEEIKAYPEIMAKIQAFEIAFNTEFPMARLHLFVNKEKTDADGTEMDQTG